MPDLGRRAIRRLVPTTHDDPTAHRNWLGRKGSRAGDQVSTWPVAVVSAGRLPGGGRGRMRIRGPMTFGRRGAGIRRVHTAAVDRRRVAGTVATRLIVRKILPGLNFAQVTFLQDGRRSNDHDGDMTTSTNATSATTHAHPGVWPSLSYRDAEAAIGYLVDVVGFIESVVHRGGPDRPIAHAELTWPDGG